MSDVCQRLARGNHAHRPHHVTVLLLAKNTIDVHPATGWQPRSRNHLKMSITFGIPFTQDSPMARSNSLSWKFAIMQHLLKGFQRRRSNVISGLLFVLISFSINSGSPCNPSTGMMRSPADIADSGWVLFQLFTTPSCRTPHMPKSEWMLMPANFT